MIVMAKTVVCALVNSRLDFANAVLYGTSVANIAKLQRLQNAHARVVKLKKRTAHIRPVLESTVNWQSSSSSSIGQWLHSCQTVLVIKAAFLTKATSENWNHQTRFQPSCSNYLEWPATRFTFRCYTRTIPICNEETYLRTGFHKLITWLSEKKNGSWGVTHCTWNFRSDRPRWSEIDDFEPIFACSASAITPSEKSSINTNRKSTTHFPMSQSLHTLQRSLPVIAGLLVNIIDTKTT